MKTIDLAGEAPNLQELLRLATEGNLILRTVDGKEFLLAEVDDFAHEVQPRGERPGNEAGGGPPYGDGAVQERQPRDQRHRDVSEEAAAFLVSARETGW